MERRQVIATKRPTQSDVAKQAGVSRATVSYVLNDRNGNMAISHETRLRVLQVIEELGYQPDTRAQSLRSGDSKTIGLLIPDIHNPHFWQTVEGVEEEARKAGYDLLLAHSNANINLEDYCIQSLSRRTISGLIIIKANKALSPKTQKRLLASGRPVVECSDSPSEFDAIITHYRDATREALRYLLELGHRRFAFINGVAELVVGVDRLEPYHEVLSQAGIPEAEHNVINCGITPEEGYQAAMQLLTQIPRPTAILAINDLLAIAVLRAATDLSLKIPQDLSVMGFDDIDLARYLSPRLTTVFRETKFEGQQATKLLIERLNNPELPIRVLSLPAKLVIRESTGKAPN